MYQQGRRFPAWDTQARSAQQATRRREDPLRSVLYESSERSLPLPRRRQCDCAARRCLSSEHPRYENRCIATSPSQRLLRFVTRQGPATSAVISIPANSIRRSCWPHAEHGHRSYLRRTSALGGSPVRHCVNPPQTFAARQLEIRRTFARIRANPPRITNARCRSCSLNRCRAAA